MGKNDGTKNEIEINEELNNKTYSRLAHYWRKFIKDCYPEIQENQTIKSERKGDGQEEKVDVKKGKEKIIKPKADIIISVEDNNNTPADRLIKYGISIKKGKANSFHQEKVEEFCDYCTHNLDMTDEEADSLKLFIYGDGTIDGTGPKEKRLSNTNEINKTYAKEIGIIQTFLDRNKEVLLYRFLKYGKYMEKADYQANYVFHGTKEGGVYCPLNAYTMNEIANLPKGRATLSIGPLSMQAYARTEEEDRGYIQIKWSTSEKDLNKIKLKWNEEREKIKERIIGDNTHGNKNQDNIKNYYNGCKVKDFYGVSKELISSINPDANKKDLVKAELINESKDNKTNLKASVRMTINNISKNISISCGTGNSVHQERIETFISYCETLGMKENEKQAFLKIHFGDGTIDGTGKISDRLKANEIGKKYTEEKEIVQNFLNKNKKDLLKRFLVYGNNGGKDKVDIIYYGNYSDGVYSTVDKVIDYLIDIPNCKKALISVGPLSIQNYGRDSKGEAKKPDSRYSIQVKWTDLEKHIRNIYELNKLNNKKQNGAEEGKKQEIELVRELNIHRNKENQNWKYLCSKIGIDFSNDLYAIRVTTNQFSKLTEKPEKTKSDIYIVKSKIKKTDLIDNNYYLDETILEKLEIKYKKIKGSGISCKLIDSKSFTYDKMSIIKFNKLFNNNYIGCGMSLYVQKEEDLKLNENVLNSWGIKYNDFCDYWKSEINIANETNITKNIRICKQIKNISKKYIKNKIDSNNDIKNKIFRGENVFEDPYNANYIYLHGELKENNVDKYSISTGSNRHNGECTIIIKP